jgi:hypothetical protein
VREKGPENGSGTEFEARERAAMDRKRHLRRSQLADLRRVKVGFLPSPNCSGAVNSTVRPLISPVRETAVVPVPLRDAGGSEKTPEGPASEPCVSRTQRSRAARSDGSATARGATVLMSFSGHGTVAMLKTYLGVGILLEDEAKQQRAAAQRALAEGAIRSEVSS